MSSTKRITFFFSACGKPVYQGKTSIEQPGFLRVLAARLLLGAELCYRKQDCCDSGFLISRKIVGLIFPFMTKYQ